MKTYDFRFDTSMFQTFLGKKLTKYKHADFIYTNSVTGVLGFEVEDCSVYMLTNEHEVLDFFSLDDEATIFRVRKAKWSDIDSLINNSINETISAEQITKVTLVNDHTILKIDGNVEYEMLDTKAIVFFLENHEICFVKQDCWFSQEIEVYKGYDLLCKVGDGRGILADFETDEHKTITVNRSFIEIQ